LKVVAQRTQTLLQDEEQWRCTGAAPAHTRSEVRRKRGRDNVVAEIQKAKKSAYRLYLYIGKATHAAMYLRRVRVVGRRFAAALTHL
jgi:hypothetical protein